MQFWVDSFMPDRTDPTVKSRWDVYIGRWMSKMNIRWLRLSRVHLTKTVVICSILGYLWFGMFCVRSDRMRKIGYFFDKRHSLVYVHCSVPSTSCWKTHQPYSRLRIRRTLVTHSNEETILKDCHEDVAWNSHVTKCRRLQVQGRLGTRQNAWGKHWSHSWKDMMTRKNQVYHLRGMEVDANGCVGQIGDLKE